jgi:hypothetical protein
MLGEKFRLDAERTNFAKIFEKHENPLDLEKDIPNPRELSRESSEEEADYDKIGGGMLKDSYFTIPKACSSQIMKENTDWQNLEGILKFEVKKIEGAKDAIKQRQDMVNDFFYTNELYSKKLDKQSKSQSSHLDQEVQNLKDQHQELIQKI